MKPKCDFCHKPYKRAYGTLNGKIMCEECYKKRKPKYDALRKKMVEIAKETRKKELIKKMRTEFGILVNRCDCFQASTLGKCTPKECYPNLYEFLYPKGGLNKKSVNTKVEVV